MEVHHSHIPSHKKKWFEYLLEFFMLFLAVFLGFVVENMREENTERHREKEYMQTMMKDLEMDTSLIRYVNGLIKEQNVALDSLLVRVNTPGILNTPNKLYEVIGKASGTKYFTFSDGTLSQLKSSGALRLIQNRKVADSIANYDYLIKWHERSLLHRIEISDKLYQLEYEIFIKNESKHRTSEQIKNLDHQLKMQKVSEEKLTEFANLAAVVREQNDKYQQNNLDEIQEHAINLHDMIKKEYHLK